MCKAVTQKKTQPAHITSPLSAAHHFACPIYIAERPDFLEDVAAISGEYLERAHKDREPDEIYPVSMTENYFHEDRLSGFAEFVGRTAWDILREQGYEMQEKETAFTEMWTQEHNKHSLMEQHIHGRGSQIVGFYFIETPENCSRLVVHDPRAGKVQIDLQEQDATVASIASKMVNFEPKPGLLIFTNAWLAHSFTRHAAETPIRFVHFNICVNQSHPQSPTNNAEVI